MSARHADESEDSNLLVNEAAAEQEKADFHRAFWKLWLLTFLIGIIVVLVFFPFLTAYVDNERHAEESAAAAAFLAELPSPVEFEPVTAEGAPPSIRLPGTGDDAVRANQVVAFQTLAATYSSKASDNQEWAIFVLSAGVLSLAAVFTKAFKGFIGVTVAEWWKEQTAKRNKKRQDRLTARLMQELTNERGQAVIDWDPHKDSEAAKSRP